MLGRTTQGSRWPHFFSPARRSSHWESDRLSRIILPRQKNCCVGHIASFFPLHDMQAFSRLQPSRPFPSPPHIAISDPTFSRQFSFSASNGLIRTPASILEHGKSRTSPKTFVFPSGPWGGAFHRTALISSRTPKPWRTSPNVSIPSLFRSTSPGRTA